MTPSPEMILALVAVATIFMQIIDRWLARPDRESSRLKNLRDEIKDLWEWNHNGDTLNKELKKLIDENDARHREERKKADEERKKDRKSFDELYRMHQESLDQCTTLRRENKTLEDAIKQVTIDHAEVQLARRRNERYEALEKQVEILEKQVEELTKQVEQIPNLQRKIEEQEQELTKARREQRTILDTFAEQQNHE